MSDEIRELSRLETVTLNSDLAQGFALKTLTDIFASFVTMKSIKSAYKGRLVSTVLHGYLSLRYLKVSMMKLCVVRTLGTGCLALGKGSSSLCGILGQLFFQLKGLNSHS